MAKVILGVALLVSMMGFSQTYKIKKIGVMGVTTKLEGSIEITNDSIFIKTISKEKKELHKLKIINKQGNICQASGQIGLYDKHQIVYEEVYSRIYWEFINSFDNSKTNIFYKVEKL